MNKLPAPVASLLPGKSGLWQWLLRTTGLEAWFRQAPTAAHVGYEERIVLVLTLAGASRSPHTTLLASAQRECQPVIAASGGASLAYTSDKLLLTWPIASESQVPVAAIYAQLRSCLRQLAGSPALELNGAAGLGWVAPGAAASLPQYVQANLREVAGLLHESQRLGGELLLTAALHQRLTPTAAGQCALHVAFEVPGHRYPATVYRAVMPIAEVVEPVAAKSITNREEFVL